jgi:hypothetical protein
MTGHSSAFSAFKYEIMEKVIRPKILSTIRDLPAESQGVTDLWLLFNDRYQTFESETTFRKWLKDCEIDAKRVNLFIDNAAPDDATLEPIPVFQSLPTPPPMLTAASRPRSLFDDLVPHPPYEGE